MLVCYTGTEVLNSLQLWPM